MKAPPNARVFVIAGPGRHAPITYGIQWSQGGNVITLSREVVPYAIAELRERAEWEKFREYVFEELAIEYGKRSCCVTSRAGWSCEI